jgi:lipopolysaccharide/colanic/teichoic acid biosynthesis glycosyltransferase
MKVEGHAPIDMFGDAHEYDESRKTRFGTFLRKTGIDELPQFFNVLFGSMSLVGPRPEIPKFVDEYRKNIPLYMVKHQVKPGITGLAQIYGFRGDNTSLERRIELDIKYIENWTLFNDIKIIFATPFKIINRNEKFRKKKK